MNVAMEDMALWLEVEPGRWRRVELLEERPAGAPPPVPLAAPTAPGAYAHPYAHPYTHAPTPHAPTPPHPYPPAGVANRYPEVVTWFEGPKDEDGTVEWLGWGYAARRSTLRSVIVDEDGDEVQTNEFYVTPK